MDLKTLIDTPPWDWPRDAGWTLRKILVDRRANESDRLIAAELAGDFTVINDELADALLMVVCSADEPDQLRARAAISLGPVLEQADTDVFEDPDDVPITEPTFRNIQDSMKKLYLDDRTPNEVRRRVLEAAVRAPETWHQDAIKPPCEPCKFVRMVVTFVISAARFHLPSIMGSVSLVMRHIF